MKVRNFLIMLMLCQVFILMIACSGDESVNNNDGFATVSGTITYPANASGKSYYVLIDGDMNGDNGYEAMCHGTCASGWSVDYSIDNVPHGIYYIYAIVRIVSSDGPPQDGDYFGIFGGTLSNPPTLPNAYVLSGGFAKFNITLGVYSE